jgi:ribosome-binding factor A
MSIKSDRLASSIQRELGDIINRQVKDTKLGFVTITAVDVTNDKSIAKVYYTVLGSDIKADAANKAINRAKGFIRSELAKRIRVRSVPELRFKYDESIEYGNKIESIIKDLHKE